MSAQNKARTLPSPIPHRSGYKPNPPEAIWEKYEIAPGGCWIWTMSTDRSGYSQTQVYGKPLAAHVVSYLLTYGDIPEGMTVNHKCAVRNCINPDHLELLTAGDNTREAASRRAVTIACIRGHYDYGVASSGYRWCRTCDREKKRARAARNVQS